jgi:hypothetical protein
MGLIKKNAVRTPSESQRMRQHCILCDKDNGKYIVLGKIVCIACLPKFMKKIGWEIK